MKTSWVRCALLVALHLPMPAAVLAAPMYVSAEFSGGLQTVIATRLTAAGYNAALFNCFTCLNPTQVSGHVIYDSAVPVPVTSTARNVDSIGPITGVANERIFELSIDGLAFHFGDAGVDIGPFIQYRNGRFNGFAFVESFLSPNQTPLQLSVQGGVITLLRTDTFQTLFSGFIDLSAGLTNIQPFDPTAPTNGSVPEPGALLLAALGLAGLGVARRRNRSA